MILAIDTSTGACSAALFDKSGACLRRADEQIGRGHSERLVPMIGELLDGATAERIIVGIGPGSFTGIRVGIAAAHGMAIGWDARVEGMSSLALIALGAGAAGPVAAVIMGGHGELFVQQFDQDPLAPSTPLLNLAPADAAAEISAETLAGPGASALLAARGWGDSLESWPSASSAFDLPEALRTLDPKPLYARAPDARPREAA
jgi:tRNA threonylcarbamoyl adenosine modification protein YeaZ